MRRAGSGELTSKEQTSHHVAPGKGGLDSLYVDWWSGQSVTSVICNFKLREAV